MHTLHRTTKYVQLRLYEIDDSEFFDMVVRVRNAIRSGTNPRMISVGTSGSYFVYEQSDNGPRIVGVFKPMDEEPYGNLKCVMLL